MYEVEQFGFANIAGAGQLTDAQHTFLMYARTERARRNQP
ncbi:hypothetical protein J2752_000456 [Halarchaeum rubridurum]|uniref:Uncharacterized protein n=1 Tax=Halarchaeum rubridurum TaxID=489911 RepID=A0A8T4GK77_9EURY|nr:hypothetical protein [Halarchaeum rubridurum]